jgi:hypothetical protein
MIEGSKTCEECMNEAKKNDTGKDQWTALPWKALTLVTKGMTHGAQKYAKHNYLGLEVDRCLDAAGRHFAQHLCGETLDSDSGLPHLTLATCELLMAQEILIRGDEEKMKWAK